jgi:cell division septum initiation protein DivIVA
MVADMGNDEKNMVAFRLSRRGYDRQDVNRYIEEMSLRFTASENALRSRIKELEARLSGEDCEKSPVAEKLTAENRALREENRRLAEENSRLSEDCRPEDSAEYREISEKLGDIILKANLDADRVKNEAEAEAEKLMSEASERADAVRLKSAVDARVLLSNVRTSLGDLTEKQLSALKTVSKDTVSEYEKLYKELEERFDAMGKLTL